jgi:AcrR family transcriptional regulator
MPRPSKFPQHKIIAAASQIVAESGPGAATITAIASAIGAPSGSIYHRFRSRDELLGRLWLEKAAFMQKAFAAALDHPDARKAALDAALSMPRSARADFEGARIMLLHRREDFLDGGWPRAMRDEAEQLGQQVQDLLSRCTRRLFQVNTKAARLQTAFAVIDIPFAAVRRHVGANEMPPPQVDAMIASATGSILDRIFEISGRDQ